MATTKYTVNGKEYNSLDEMPPEDRAVMERHMRFLEDKNGDGVPDLFEGLKGGTRTETRVVQTGSADSDMNFEKLMGQFSQRLDEQRITGKPVDSTHWQTHDQVSMATTRAAPKSSDTWRLVAMLGALAALGALLVWWLQ